MARHNAVWWRKLVKEVSRGGALKAVAERHGVQAGTLRWWRTEFNRRGREGSVEQAKFLPVVVASVRAKGLEPLGADEGAVDVVVELGAARISLRGGVTAAHVEAIVRGLGGRC